MDAFLGHVRPALEAIGKSVAEFGGIGFLVQLLFISPARATVIKDGIDQWVKWIHRHKAQPFGQIEALKFIELLDHYAGNRLWSRKRWRFTTWVAFACFIIACINTGVSIAYADGPTVWSDISKFDKFLFIASLPIPLISMAGFALSISITRFVANTVLQHALSQLTASIGFLVLIGIHLALYKYWSGILEFGIWAIEPVLYDLLRGQPNQLWNTLCAHFGSFGSHFSGSPLADVFRIHKFGDAGPGWEGYRVFKGSLDIIANGVRIAFALVFLASYLVVLRYPLVNAWAYAKLSDKFILAVLFGAIGGLLATAYQFGGFLLNGLGWVWRLIV